MNRLACLMLPLLVGCASLRDSAAEYAKELAIQKISEAVDHQLDKRGLSLAELKALADDDRNGQVDQGEIVRLAKQSLLDTVDLRVQVESDKAKADLEEKIKALANVKDLDELKDVAKSQGWGTAGSLLALILTIAYQRVRSANRHAKTEGDLAATNARIDAFEKLTGIDLNRDGRIGGLAQGGAAQGGGAPAPPPAGNSAAA